MGKGGVQRYLCVSEGPGDICVSEGFRVQRHLCVSEGSRDICVSEGLPACADRIGRHLVAETNTISHCSKYGGSDGADPSRYLRLKT